MNVTEIWCPNCDRKIPAPNINIMEMIGKCDGCDHVFSIKNVIPSDRVTDPEKPPSRPSGIRVENTGVDIQLIRRWFNPGLFFLLFFCIAWDSFLVFWYTLALSGIGGDGIQWIMVLFPILHVAVGVGLTYYVLCGFLNRTTVTISSHEVNVRHDPIPWCGNRSVPRNEILEIELESNGVEDSSVGRQMAVSVHHRDSRQIVLLNGLDFKQAEFMAWNIANAAKVPLVRKNTPGSRNNRSTPPRWLQSMISTKQQKR